MWDEVSSPEVEAEGGFLAAGSDVLSSVMNRPSTIALLRLPFYRSAHFVTLALGSSFFPADPPERTQPEPRERNREADRED